MNSIVKNNKGSAVLLTIFISAILLTLGIGFNWLVKEHLNTSIALQNKSESMIKVLSAADKLLFSLAQSKMASDKITFNANTFDGISELPIDNTPTKTSDNIIIKIQDSNGRISINQFKDKIMSRLMQNLNVDNVNSVIDSINDWIDSDNIPRLQGAEKSAYANKGYTPRNHDIQYLEELLLVNGINKNIATTIEPYITILPTSTFNVNTASKETIMAYFNINEKTYDAIKGLNCEEVSSFLSNKIEDTEDDNHCKTSGCFDVTIQHGEENSMYTVKFGIRPIQTIVYPLTIFYWKES
ncbi:general secretion pathway protein K [Candidatus Magnetoovum chiemensis]|nr:general secretion pathway protein K [Candidatus Magnetoovum chiemensis]